jgi:hypothetical protein
MLIFAEVLTWHENYGQAGKKIAYFCHINSTSRNLNTALWANCRLPTHTFSFYSRILLDFAHWFMSCDGHPLISACKMMQTSRTSREQPTSMCPRIAGPLRNCQSPTRISLQRNTHGRHLSSGIDARQSNALLLFRQYNCPAIYPKCTVPTCQWRRVRTYIKCSTNKTQHVSLVGKKSNY